MEHYCTFWKTRTERSHPKNRYSLMLFQFYAERPGFLWINLQGFTHPAFTLTLRSKKKKNRHSLTRKNEFWVKLNCLEITGTNFGLSLGKTKKLHRQKKSSVKTKKPLRHVRTCSHPSHALAEKKNPFAASIIQSKRSSPPSTSHSQRTTVLHSIKTKSNRHSVRSWIQK